MTPFEAELMKVAEQFLSGDREAFGIVYKRTHGLLAARAVDRGADPQDAEDLSSNAIMYVASRGTGRWDGRSLMALLNTSLDWQVHNSKRKNREVLNADLPLTYDTDDIGEEFEHPLDLEELEERRIQEGADPHPFLTSITTRTPEDETLAENLRAKLERIGRNAEGDRAWEIYSAVVLDERSQQSVATEYGISQQRVAQVINEVAVGIRNGLLLDA